ncbi:BTB/POZ and MATH domain-containing protein 3-like [Nilaparvata lugens]|uniref:BTB/POZ and MATH domain-containing protein 3-like n=1 Tax=Nilaparvata lugens TaxID=108931 RepID=UPI00193E888A|nr:BTB/POZ and MATH domain-containing protein 3-like [Nilaparvata lugens]
MGSKAGEIQGNSCRNPKKYGKGMRGDSASPDNQSFETRFHRLVDSDMLSDCEFVLGSQKTSIKGHKVFFSAASEVFHAMFCSDLKETNPVHVEDLEPEGFKAMKQFIYTELPVPCASLQFKYSVPCKV